MPLKNFAALIVPLLLSYFYGMNLWLKTQNIQADYFVNYWVIGAVIVTNLLLLLAVSARWLLISNIVSIAIIYLCDLAWMSLQIGNGDLSNLLYHYALHAKWLYLLLAIALVASYCARRLEQRSTYHINSIILSISIISALLILPAIISFDWTINTDTRLTLNLLAVGALLLLALDAVKNLISTTMLNQLTARFLAISVLLQLLADIIPPFIHNANDRLNAVTESLKSNSYAFIPLVVVIIVFISLRSFHKPTSFQLKTSGNFGKSEWMTIEDLKKLNCYDAATGPIIGTDEHNKLLHYPLKNRLILAPTGLGKSVAAAITYLLSENGPALILDSKGELWVTTARYRSEVLGRQVVCIDPFGITRSPDFSNNKSATLQTEYFINPFDYIPEDEGQRDRMITAFASSFIISENHNGNSRHFDENAKILIRGFIDYIMKKYPREERTMVKLFELMSASKEEADTTFAMMVQAGGRAAAAANQILRVGAQEQGSILSTSYRQIDWLSDINISRTLSKSNFNLKSFLKGNMDIYIVLPEEQIAEHGRLMRMFLALLKAIITQANPSELPKKKMLFLLDELAQLGYCPDIEQFIEIMRSRNVVVWAIFQSLKQIKLYKKDDLFLTMPIKQIFTTDDLDTMRWIQSLIDKTTIKNKSVSSSASDSHQKMKIYSGSTGTSESENLQETGVDLIKLSEIRELSYDQQLVLHSGYKPLRCKKAIYFKHPFFTGRFDANPLEKDRS